MIFQSLNGLISYWEGGKTYEDKQEGMNVCSVSDEARTLPYVTSKFYEVKKLYDELGGSSNELISSKLKQKLGAVYSDGTVKADARIKKYVKGGGRSWEEYGAFLYPFIDDCIEFFEQENDK